MDGWLFPARGEARRNEGGGDGWMDGWMDGEESRGEEQEGGEGGEGEEALKKQNLHTGVRKQMSKGGGPVWGGALGVLFKPPVFFWGGKAEDLG